MLHLLQLCNLVNDKQDFINVFNDLSFELEELGYKDCPKDLVNDLLESHFGITLECDRQLAKVTECILNNQNKLEFLKSL